MGFFDRFGAGGGDLTVELSAPESAAGGTVSGTVSFTAGKRPQNINGISVKLVCTLSQNVKGPQGVQRQSQQRELGVQQLAAPFQSNPGQRYDMPFQIAVPSDAPGSNRGTVDWRVATMCDIEGEIDDGAGAEVLIRGGAWGAQPQMQGGAAGTLEAMKQQAIAAHAAAVGGAILAPGTAVVAQWQDGNWYRARVSGFQNGMYGIDWDDAKLGASTWCAVHQVRPA